MKKYMAIFLGEPLCVYCARYDTMAIDYSRLCISVLCILVDCLGECVCVCFCMTLNSLSMLYFLYII